jgi:hypothetical protein
MLPSAAKEVVEEEANLQDVDVVHLQIKEMHQRWYLRDHLLWVL